MDNILVVLDGSDNDNLAMQQAVKLMPRVRESYIF